MFKALDSVKKIQPLVLHYTNEVTINDCANITLALGASPLMSYSLEEVEEIVRIANAVVINIGTMNSAHIELFVAAGKAANKYNKPVILDPVGSFATASRTKLVNRLLDEINFTVIKGNQSEIKCLLGLDSQGKGVDSFEDSDDNEFVVYNAAKKMNCVIVGTGKIDIISDGVEIIKIDNGTSKLKLITGTGCMSASLIGSYLGCSEDVLEAAAMGVLSMSLAGELADKENPGVGTFKVNLMDEVYKLTPAKLEKLGRIDRI